jgi:hypothetical protein
MIEDMGKISPIGEKVKGRNGKGKGLQKICPFSASGGQPVLYKNVCQLL